MASQDGHYVVGTLYNMGAGEPFELKGATVTPYVVRVVVGDDIVKIEYRDEAGAKKAVGVVEVGKQVSLRVGLRPIAYKGSALLFFSGRVAV